MKFEIFGTWPDGTEDHIVITGDTVEEIRQKADEEIAKRSWTGVWSAEIQPEDVE